MTSYINVIDDSNQLVLTMNVLHNGGRQWRNTLMSLTTVINKCNQFDTRNVYFDFAQFTLITHLITSVSLTTFMGDTFVINLYWLRHAWHVCNQSVINKNHSGSWSKKTKHVSRFRYVETKYCVIIKSLMTWLITDM